MAKNQYYKTDMPWNKTPKDVQLNHLFEKLGVAVKKEQAHPSEVLKKPNDLLKQSEEPGISCFEPVKTIEEAKRIDNKIEIKPPPTIEITGAELSKEPRNWKKSGDPLMGGIKYEILYQGSNAMLRVELDSEKSFIAESGAMVAMSDTVKLRGKMSGGIISALFRKGLAKEKFFFQEYRAEGAPGEILLAPSTPGSVAVLEMDGSCEYAVQKDGFLGCTTGLAIDTKVQGIFKGLYSGEGFFVLKISGEGVAFINAFGGIHLIDIPSGKSYLIDNKHLVAWPAKARYEIKPSAGIVSTFTSGEILVNKFHGPSRIYIQTRDSIAFTYWMRRIMQLDKLIKAERK